MTRHRQVFSEVEKLYQNSKQPLAQWLWQFHVQYVAKTTEYLSQKYEANVEIAVAGALLHDFADVWLERSSDDHETRSIEEARKILEKVGYTSVEVKQVLDEVITPHSCYPGNLPTLLEGKILATADAVAHLQTDFYLQFAWMHLPEDNYSSFRRWVSEKIERDYHQKIFFEDERKQLAARYAALKEVFSTQV